MDTSLAALSHLTTMGDMLPNLIKALSFPVHMRDVRTDKYLLANKYQAENNGYDSEEGSIVGLTNADLHARMSIKISSFNAFEKTQPELQETFDKLNRRVQLEKQAINYTERWLAGTGFIYFGKSKKIPVLGRNQKCIAILTISENVTHRANLFDLFDHYKKHYAIKQAAQQFLRYLGI